MLSVIRKGGLLLTWGGGMLLATLLLDDDTTLHAGEGVKRWEEKLRRALLFFFFFSLCLPVAIQQTALGLLFAFFPYYCWRNKTLPITPLNYSLLLFFAGLLLSTFLSLDVLNSLVGYRKLWLIGAFFIPYHLLQSPREAERLISLMVIVATVVAVYGIVQHFTGIDWSRQIRGLEPSPALIWFEGFRTKGFHPSGITYAHNLLFPLSILTAWVFAPIMSGKQRLLLIGGWAVMILALLFSLTRGVWVAYVVVLLVLGIVRGGKTLVGVACGLVLLGGLLFTAGAGVQERARKAFDLEENLGRSQIWLANLDMLTDRPLFGWGYGNYRNFREPYYERYPKADHSGHAHNSFLQIAVDSGLVGLTAFLAFFVVLLRTGWHAYRLLPPSAEPSMTEPLRSFALGAWLSIIGFLIGGLTQHNFGDAEVVIVMWTVAGLLAKMSTWAMEEKKD
jgi:putative inorganic carbon (hco3(-)) transporter